MRTPTLRKRNFFRPWERAVHVMRMPRQPPIGLHGHEFFEIALVISGSAIHVTEGHQHQVTAGDVLAIDLQCRHGYRKPVHLNLINLLFRRDFITRLKRRLRPAASLHVLFGAGPRGTGYLARLQLAPEELQEIEGLVDRIEDENARPSPEGELAVEAWASLIIFRLLRHQAEVLTPSTKERPPTGFSRLQTWLERNLEKPVTVHGMAKKAGMSERSFFRTFHKEMGMAPLEWVRRARLDRAALLLREQPSLRIAEVAMACGFEDPAYFSRTFSAAFERSPRAYRESKARKAPRG